MADRNKIIQMALERGLDPATIFPDYQPGEENAQGSPAPEQTAETQTAPASPETTGQPQTTPVPSPTGGGILGNPVADPFANGSANRSVLSNTAPDPFQNPQPEVDNSRAQVTAKNSERVLTKEDIESMSYGELVQLASMDTDVSGLSQRSREQLSAALRGSTTTGLGELFVGDDSTAASKDGTNTLLFGLIDLGNPEIMAQTAEFEEILERKYSDFVEENPEYDLNLIEKMGRSITTGSPVPDIEGVEGNILSTPTREFTDTAANAALGGFGDEITGLISEDGADTIRQNREELYEESLVAGFGAEVLGALAPGSVIAKSVGLGAKGTSVASNVYKGIGVGAVEGAVAGAGYTDPAVNEERFQNALFGGAVGAAVGGFSPIAIAGILKTIDGVRPSKRELNAMNNVIETISASTELPKTKIISGLKDGKNLNRIMLENNVPEGDILEINRGLLVNNASRSDIGNSAADTVDAIRQPAAARAQGAADAQSEAIEVAGQAVENVRRSNIDATQVVIGQMRQGNSAPVFTKNLLAKAQEDLQFRGDLLDQSGYRDYEKATLMIADDNRLFIINKGAKPKSIKKGEEIPEGSIELGGKYYDIDKLTEYQPSLELTQSVQSNINKITSRELKEGAAADQVLGRNASQVSDDIRSSEQELISDLSAADSAYGNAKTMQSLQSDLNTAFSKEIKGDEIKAILDKVAESNVTPVQRLNALTNAIDNATASGNITKLLDNQSNRFNEITRDAMRQIGMEEHVIDNIQRIAREMDLAKNIKTGSSGGLLTSYWQEVGKGALGRWYLGPGRAVAASMIFNTISRATRKSASPSSAIAKYFKKLKPEMQNRMIQNFVGLPDDKFSALMEGIINAKSEKQLFNLLVSGTSSAPIVANTE